MLAVVSAFPPAKLLVALTEPVRSAPLARIRSYAPPERVTVLLAVIPSSLRKTPPETVTEPVPAAAELALTNVPPGIVMPSIY